MVVRFSKPQVATVVFDDRAADKAIPMPVSLVVKNGSNMRS
jgi:hypothetical protein